MNRRKAPWVEVVKSYRSKSDLDQRPPLQEGQVFRNLGFFYLGGDQGFFHMITAPDGRVFAYPSKYFKPRRHW